MSLLKAFVYRAADLSAGCSRSVFRGWLVGEFLTWRGKRVRPKAKDHGYLALERSPSFQIFCPHGAEVLPTALVNEAVGFFLLFCDDVFLVFVGLPFGKPRSKRSGPGGEG